MISKVFAWLNWLGLMVCALLGEHIATTNPVDWSRAAAAGFGCVMFIGSIVYWGVVQE